jgi:hypothetical protein
MRWESSIVPGVGSFRVKLALFILTASVAALISWLTRWKFSSVMWFTTMFTFFALLCGWGVRELWKDYGPKRN